MLIEVDEEAVDEFEGRADLGLYRSHLGLSTAVV